MTQSDCKSRTWLHLAAMLALVAGNAWLQRAYGDHIGHCDGLGYDGAVYAEVARDLPGRLEQPLTNDRLRRILPSAVVWLEFQMLGIADATNQQINDAFSNLDVACLLASIMVWHAVAAQLRIGPAGLWFGCIAMYGNFAFAKWAWYYPVLTDCTTFLLAMLMLLAVLRRSLAGLTLIVLVGSFASSTFNLWALPLFLFMQTPAPVRDASVDRVRLLTGAAVAVCLAMVFVSYYVLQFQPFIAFSDHYVFTLMPVSAAACALFLWRGWLPLAAQVSGLRPGELAGRPLAWGAAAWLGVTLIVKLIGESIQRGSTVEISSGIVSFVFAGAGSIFVRGTALPLVFMAAHILFFGPLLAVVVMRWSSIVRRMGRQTLGLVFLMGMVVLFTLDSESRHLFVPVPFLVAFAAKEIDDVRPAWPFWCGMVVLSFLVSMAWQPLWPIAFSDDFYGNFLGPWMTLEGYLVGLRVGVAAILLCAGFLRGRDASQSNVV